MLTLYYVILQELFRDENGMEPLIGRRTDGERRQGSLPHPDSHSSRIVVSFWLRARVHAFTQRTNFEARLVEIEFSHQDA